MSNQNQGASIEAERANPTPWRITAPDERKGREIVDARGGTVAKLTALDMANAELIVTSVNARRTPAAQVGAGELPPLTGSVAEALAMRDAEIADLRAQLAQQGQEPEKYQLTTEQIIRRAAAELEAFAPWMLNPASTQPATERCFACHGQGYNVKRPGEQLVACKQCAGSGKMPGIALASAQPADSIKDHVLREVVNSLRDTALVYHAHGSLRERLRQCLDPLLTSGAQPDQRDSAAEITVDWPPCNPACDPAEGSNGRNRHCSCDAAKASIAR